MADAFVRQCRPALGTLVEIALHRDDLLHRASQPVFDAAFACIDEVQRQMSFHDPASALSQLNRAAAGAVVLLPAWTYDVLTTAIDIGQATGGMFDCRVGADLVRAGLLPAHVPSTGLFADTQTGPERPSLRLLGENQVAVLEPVRVDLGGIAKGFAVDKAVEQIARMGIARAIVNAGGDLRVAGDYAERIMLRLPSAPSTLVPLGELADGAVATSAPYFSLTRSAADAPVCALFDPAGTSLTINRSYTVIAPSCVVADALTKAVAVARHRQRDAETGAIAGPRTIPQPFDAAFLDRYAAQAFIL